MKNMLSEALYYAERGWFVFPCRERPGVPYKNKDGFEIIPSEKQPYTRNGLHDATTDEEQIKAWWSVWKDAMVGVNAGKSGLFVVDIDKKNVNGLDTFNKWDINDTAGLHSITPSGGMHIVFSGEGKTSANAKTGIDTRGEGGYFIAPPSKILEGKTTGEYRKFDDWGRDPGVIPDGLMGHLFPDNTVEYVRGNTSLPEGVTKQLSRHSLNFLVNGAEHGERNTELFKVLADFNGCGYTSEQARDIVRPTSDRIGLSVSEFEVVLMHAYSTQRTSSIPDSIQEKILSDGKRAVVKITSEEQGVMEDALLACLLMDNSIIPVISDILNYEDFRSFNNRLIYKAINKLYNVGAKADYITVSNEVNKETDKIPLDDISKMINQYLINTDSAVTYANIIQEKASIRKIEALMDNKNKYIKAGSLVEIINSIEKDVSDIALYGGAKSTSVLSAKQATAVLTEHTRKMMNGEIEQLKTGFIEYDISVGGLFSNEMVILAGRAGDGKTSLSISLANEIALRQKKNVAFFSLEMSNNEVLCRLICQLTGIPFKDVFQGKLNGNQWKLYTEAKEKIDESGLYFDDGFGMTVAEIRSKIRKLMEKDIKLVMIDQLEQIRGYDDKPAYIQYDKICYEIKELTKEFDIPIILNHQLNRGITGRHLKDPEPQLSDLNQAGEKPTNQVWVITHKKDEHNKIIQSKINVLKNRNGPTMDFEVVFIGERMLFANPARKDDLNGFNKNIKTNVSASNGAHWMDN